jgi:transposase
MSTPQRNAARTHLIELMLQGFSFQKAAVQVQVEPPIKQAMAYRLTQRVRSEGQQALVDGRHGHPFKVRGEILDFIRERCTANPLLSSPTLQHELLQRFDCSISTSQLNRVRARFGLSNPNIQPPHSGLAGPDHTPKHSDLTLKKTKALK